MTVLNHNFLCYAFGFRPDSCKTIQTMTAAKNIFDFTFVFSTGSPRYYLLRMRSIFVSCLLSLHKIFKDLRKTKYKTLTYLISLSYCNCCSTMGYICQRCFNYQLVVSLSACMRYRTDKVYLKVY